MKALIASMGALLAAATALLPTRSGHHALPLPSDARPGTMPLALLPPLPADAFGHALSLAYWQPKGEPSDAQANPVIRWHGEAHEWPSLWSDRVFWRRSTKRLLARSRQAETLSDDTSGQCRPWMQEQGTGLRINWAEADTLGALPNAADTLALRRYGLLAEPVQRTFDRTALCRWLMRMDAPAYGLLADSMALPELDSAARVVLLKQWQAALDSLARHAPPTPLPVP